MDPFVPARYHYANGLLHGVTVDRQGTVYLDDRPLRAAVRTGGLTVHVRSKMFRVARLILTSFGQPPPTKHHCASNINRDVRDCRLENLEWVSRGVLHSRRQGAKPSGLPAGVRLKTTVQGPRYQAVYRGKSLGCFDTPEAARYARECEFLGVIEASANYLG
jgi:hypothetical protein